MLALAPHHPPGPLAQQATSASSAASTTSGSSSRAASRSLPSPQKRHHQHRSSAVSTSSSSSASHPQPSSARTKTPSQSPAPTPTTLAPPSQHPDIANFSSPDLLRLLAQLLNRIATANDRIYHASQAAVADPSSDSQPTTHSRSYSFDDNAALNPPPSPSSDTPLYKSLTTASRSSVASSTSPLFFHARNVPTISIESYLLRILKYCPTTNEVFLSLLVYFDRMNKLGEAVQKEWEGVHGQDNKPSQGGVMASPLIIDSYNVHRLIIAGITVASKFFSDVFYTNSRYAKVGGLPTQELNKLELQFLLLNDFRLAIPPEELQLYFEQLLLHAAEPAAPPLPGLTPTGPGYELFGDAAFSSALYPLSGDASEDVNNVPPSPARPVLPDAIEPPAYSSTASSVAPTPSTCATDGMASSSSASTITQSLYDGPSDTPTNDPEVEEDDDPTVRMGIPAQSQETAVDEEEGRKTPGRHITSGHAIQHSQYSSYTQTDFGDDEQEEDIVGQATSGRREESPAASLRFVDGHWDRGSVKHPYEDDDAASVNEVVVYRPERGRTRHIS